jgi:hypothetical protein
MLGEKERTGLEHENALAAAGTAEPQVLRYDAAKSSSTNDDEIEWPHSAVRLQLGIRPSYGVGTSESFIKSIADVPPKDVERKTGMLRP